MGTVIIDLTISLDGFVAGPNDGPGNGLGDSGMPLFDWMLKGPKREGVDWRLSAVPGSTPIVDEWLRENGAIIFGRRTFDIAGGWASGHPIDGPVFVVTHEPPAEGEWNPRLEFAASPEEALERAQAAAGDKTVSIGGASIAQQLLRVGLVDEIQVAIAPLILGGGVRLLEHLGPDPITLEQTRVVVSDNVTHLRYRVVRD